MAERPLHLGVDGRELIGEPTGVGRYLERVLEQWMAAPDFPHRVTVFLHGDPPAQLAGRGRIEWRIERAARGGTRWEQLNLPRALSHASVDAFFAVGYTAPLRTPCPVVVVVHDVSFAAHPEWFHWREGLRRRVLTRWTARRAATVLTLSQFSSAEIVRTLSVSPDRIRLAPPGAPSPSASWTKSSERLVLYVGSMFNRRHITDLIEAFALVSARLHDARLILVGANRSVPRIDPRGLATRLGIGEAVEWREYVDDGELARLYGRARVFVFLSEYEGFAMTPMEALAHGVPSVLLDTPVSREIYGDAAVRVPLIPGAIADALVRLLDDDDLRANVLAVGRERLAQFSWARTATVIRDALEASVRR